jgi:hypothetical protein
VSDDRPLDLLDGGETSLLETVDSLLNRGVLLNGDLVLGLADVDLIYLELSVLLAAADRILRPATAPPAEPSPPAGGDELRPYTPPGEPPRAGEDTASVHAEPHAHAAPSCGSRRRSTRWPTDSACARTSSISTSARSAG